MRVEGWDSPTLEPPAMDDDYRAFFETVRETCPRGLWSRGVSFHRAGAVSLMEGEEGHFLFRVAATGSLVAESVSLFPEDEDWECSCRSRQEVCEHVAAAAIALKRILEEGTEIRPQPAALSHVGYRLEPSPGGLSMTRVVVTGGEEIPVETSLVALSRGRVDGPRIVPGPEDLELEQALGSWRRGPLPHGTWARALPILARCRDLTLEGEPITAEAAPLLPSITVDDHREGFRLGLEMPSVSRRLGDGLVLSGGVLCLLGQVPLTRREVEELERGRIITRERAGELVTEILPDLERRARVLVRSHRLPRTVTLKPRIVIRATREGALMSLTPSIVYGDPAAARLEGSRLIHLGGDVPLRNREQELRLQRQLARLSLAAGETTLLGGENAVALARRLQELPLTIEGEGLERFFLAPPLEARLETGKQSFELILETSADAPGAPRGSRAHPSAAMAAWIRGEQLVPLTEGGWAPLPADWFARFGPLLMDLLESRDSRGRVPRACLPQLGELCRAFDLPEPDGARAIARLAESLEEESPLPLPPDLRGELRSYQKQGVRWLGRLRRAEVGGLLADDMGLGKTLQTLCVLERRSLVVCPTSLLHNWADEIQRFRPGLSFSTFHGPNRRLDPEAGVTLTTYAILRLDLQQLSAARWDAIVLDEAQAIKNPQSQVAQAAFALEGDFRLALTGTPVENRLDELWSQFHFTNPGLLGGRSGFEERFSRPIAEGDEQAAERLRRTIRPFVLRRLKREVAPELPPRTEIELYCALSDHEREIYDALRAATRKEVIARLRAGESVFAALEALLRLRQAACHPALLPGRDDEDSAKLRLLLDRLEQAAEDGHRALVFSQWTSLLDLIEPRLAEAGIAHLRLDGSTPNRSKVVEEFQHEQGPPVLLISLKAGGSGLNLTAADHVFLMDPWWNPAVEDQAADRTHRIGQERPVFVHRLIAEDTVEERILSLQQSKRALADAALAGGAAAGSLTREDLIALLN